jgi:hypothetical protein
MASAAAGAARHRLIRHLGGEPARGGWLTERLPDLLALDTWSASSGAVARQRRDGTSTTPGAARRHTPPGSCEPLWYGAPVQRAKRKKTSINSS